ncbi:hypothetical protein HOLleu_22620 [Holothuria leucospilota]|uniref:PB1 domain-containing protein n=1 Tax=Holothuria leucospilota TaxID=206669 RepID=A0A9Q1H4R1_HOLLE|nr:hypothetical protein HOLleu_22620 [Holothuria leucospilota]
MDPCKLRVVITDSNIGKLYLQERPTSVEKLKDIIINKFDINYDFSLQYADSDFGGDMFSLTDINDLPRDIATIKVVAASHIPLDLSNVNYSDLSSASTDSVADSSHDTISISSSDDLQSLETKLQGSWPDVSQIPKLGPELELVF